MLCVWIATSAGASASTVLTWAWHRRFKMRCTDAQVDWTTID